MKKMKLLVLSSVTVAALMFTQSAQAADKTISVKLSNYLGNKSSVDIDITYHTKFRARESQRQSGTAGRPALMWQTMSHLPDGRTRAQS